VGDHIELAQGDPTFRDFYDNAFSFDSPALLDSPRGHILYLLHYDQPTLVDGFAVVDMPSVSILHQQTLPGQQLGTDADDPHTGHFVLYGCHVPRTGSASPASCTFWVVDAHTGKVKDKATIASLTVMDFMTIDAQNGRLLLYDGVSAVGSPLRQPDQIQVQLQLLSLYPLRLLRTIPLPHPYGAFPYSVVQQGIGVDEASGRALVISSHSLDLSDSPTDTAPGTARLVDTRSGRVLKTLMVGAQPATVVVDSALHRAYVANAMSCDVSVVDMRAGKLVARVRTGRKFPVAELVDAQTGNVFVIAQYAGVVTMFDAATTRMDPSGC
jgi:hypothetical protein